MFFFFEFFTKVIAMGFVFGRNSYLKDGWNKLDFVVVGTGFMSLFGLGKISALRTIRLLRPLRSINKIEGLRILVNSIIKSVPKILNVLIFFLFIIILMAVFALHMFNGMFEYRCRLTEEPILNIDGLYEWPMLEDYNKLCNLETNNCPDGTFCGNPVFIEEMKLYPFSNRNIIP